MADFTFARHTQQPGCHLISHTRPFFSCLWTGFSFTRWSSLTQLSDLFRTAHTFLSGSSSDGALPPAPCIQHPRSNNLYPLTSGCYRRSALSVAPRAHFAGFSSCRRPLAVSRCWSAPSDQTILPEDKLPGFRHASGGEKLYHFLRVRVSPENTINGQRSTRTSADAAWRYARAALFCVNTRRRPRFPSAGGGLDHGAGRNERTIAG